MKLDAYTLSFNCPTFPSWGTAIVNQDKDFVHLIKEDEAKDIILGILHKNVPIRTHDFSMPLGKGSHIYYGDTGFDDATSEPILLGRFDKVFINEIPIPAPFFLAIIKDKTSDHDGRLQIKYQQKIRYGEESNLMFFEKAREILGLSENTPWLFLDLQVREQEELLFTSVYGNTPKEVEALRKVYGRSDPLTPEITQDAFHAYLLAPHRFQLTGTGSDYWKVISTRQDDFPFLKELVSNVTEGRTDDIFSIFDVEEATRIWDLAKPDDRNRAFRSSIVSAILGHYKDFLSSFNIFLDPPLQIIYYGAPGTGKSFNIDEGLKNKNIPDSQVKRVIFYPDYSYSDFIGGLSPVTGDDDQPKYEFVAGPFTKILKDAFENPKKAYYVVIEEINRGNPAAIFGDIFQLLDRGADGRSKYTITNKDICSFLRDGNTPAFTNNRVWLPRNLSIVCTMNTADQNVFVLDTAFKRRFAMEYVPIDFKKLKQPKLEAYEKSTEVFKGSKDLKDVFHGTELEAFVSANEQAFSRNWPTFAQIVNERINIINRSGDSISEDKKLGPFFVTLEELKNRQKFADKVLYYLKQDVFKYTDIVLKPSFQTLYDDYVNHSADIFELFASVK